MRVATAARQPGSCSRSNYSSARPTVRRVTSARPCAVDEHRARRGVQARAAAIGAGPEAAEARQLLAHGVGLGLAEAALEVRQDALEGVALALVARPRASS